MSRKKRQCKSGKVGFKSEVQAEVAAERSGRWYNVPARIYGCHMCGMFHIATVKQG